MSPSRLKPRSQRNGRDGPNGPQEFARATKSHADIGRAGPYQLDSIRGVQAFEQRAIELDRSGGDLGAIPTGGLQHELATRNAQNRPKPDESIVAEAGKTVRRSHGCARSVLTRPPRWFQATQGRDVPRVVEGSAERHHHGSLLSLDGSFLKAPIWSNADSD